MDSILFLDRLTGILIQAHHEFPDRIRINKKLYLHLTNVSPEDQARIHKKAIRDYAAHDRLEVYERRFVHNEIVNSLGPEEEIANTVVYVCGPPSMTDEVVEALRNVQGMSEDRVLCEKWW